MSETLSKIIMYSENEKGWIVEPKIYLKMIWNANMQKIWLNKGTIWNKWQNLYEYKSKRLKS